MGVYNAVPAPGLYPGDNYTLSNASLGGAVLTQQVAIAQLAGNPANVTIINKSTATLTVEVSWIDVQADYQPLSGGIVAANTASSFSTTAPFLAVLPSADPGSGIIEICR